MKFTGCPGGRKVPENKPRDTEDVRRGWDEHANSYDDWCQTFEGAVEHHVDWELLKGYLPQSRDARILDAGGGTGRITLPLAKLGYSVTLCDISPAMLNVARQKMRREGVSDQVEILECDVHRLRFADRSFDFVLCWDGMIEAAEDLIRVTKRGGRISVFLLNRCGIGISKFQEDPDSALALLGSAPDYICHDGEKHLAVSAEEARELFETRGVKVIGIHAVCGMLDLLSVPEEARRSRTWDKGFFGKVTDMLLKLSREPSVKGLSRHLVLYGERT
jgi:SAM-dependent methyltransferase